MESGGGQGRNHPGAAIDGAGDFSGAPAEVVKSLRGPVLTADTPGKTLRLLAEAYSALEAVATEASNTPGLRAAA